MSMNESAWLTVAENRLMRRLMVKSETEFARTRDLLLEYQTATMQQAVSPRSTTDWPIVACSRGDVLDPVDPSDGEGSWCRVGADLPITCLLNGAAAEGRFVTAGKFWTYPILFRSTARVTSPRQTLVRKHPVTRRALNRPA